MAKAKADYKKTGNEDDIGESDYVFQILYTKDINYPITKAYNHYRINEVLSGDYENVIHANKAIELNLKGREHFLFLCTVVRNRRIKMYEQLGIKKDSKEVQYAKQMVCSDMELSPKDLDNYLSILGAKLIDDYCKEYKNEIKEAIKGKRFG